MGFHAGESETAIFLRKKEEIRNAGESFWLVKSFKAKTRDIQKIGQQAVVNNQELYCIFVQASQIGGAQPTKTGSIAVQFSLNSHNWLPIPKGIKVTGKIDRKTTALVLESLNTIDGENQIDLWRYSDYLKDSDPIKIRQGASTVCCIRKDSKGMISRFRKVIAVGKLKAPFAVWLK